MMFEQEMARGDLGEHVKQLQEWLRQLGHYEGMVDGEFGEVTENALHRFQELTGLERDGQVQAKTWELLEQHAGQPAGGGQLSENSQERQWSEDGKWWWDGIDWRAAEGQPESVVVAETVAVGHLSEDGQWQWDGQQWLAAQVAEVAEFLGDAAEELAKKNKPKPGRSEADARKLVPAHIEPKDCFIEFKSTKVGWGPIDGTGCAHWVSHQRSGPTGTAHACQLGFKYRVTEVLATLTQASTDLSDAKVGDVWSAPAGHSHIGIVRAVNKDPKTSAVVSVEVENDSSESGGVVRQIKTDGSVYR